MRVFVSILMFVSLTLHASNMSCEWVLKKSENTFLKYSYDYRTEAPNFAKYDLMDLIPIVEKLLKSNKNKIHKIANNPVKANFSNTILAIEKLDSELNRYLNYYYLSDYSLNSKKVDYLKSKIEGPLNAYSMSISTNEKLFERVEEVYLDRKNHKYSREQLKLIEESYESFKNSALSLTAEQRVQYLELQQNLSKLQSKFSENLMKQTNESYIEFSKDDLIGLSPEQLQKLLISDSNSKLKDSYQLKFSVDNYINILSFAESRETRKKAYNFWGQLGNEKAYDNSEVAKDIVNTKHAIAQLFGYKNYAESVLKSRMAENIENVDRFIEEYKSFILPKAKEEISGIFQFAKTKGFDGEQLKAWDLRFYKNLIAKEKFNLDIEKQKEYFELNNVFKSLIKLTEQIYNVKLRKRTDIEAYADGVFSYEIIENNKPIAILSFDLFQRSNKQRGAWMAGLNQSYKVGHTRSMAFATVNMNLSKEKPGVAQLMTFDSVITLFHEMGHALHHSFSKTAYNSFAGTNVPRDVVELPSQFYENFAWEPSVLKNMAKHYKTGESIPEEMLNAILEFRQFGAALDALAQLKYIAIDRAYYGNGKVTTSLQKLESRAVEDINLFPSGSLMGTSFSHIMEGGYSMAYYSYKWAEVLDAHAFEVFKREGIYNRETAQRWYKNILSKGNSINFMEAYETFAGEKPDIKPMLIRDGILDKEN